MDKIVIVLSITSGSSVLLELQLESQEQVLFQFLSQSLIDLEISHEEFITILKEKDKYEKMKENVRNANEKQENMRLSSVNLRT